VNARALAALLCLLCAVAFLQAQDRPRPWSAAERAVIADLWIRGLGPLPPDPSNRVADDPRAARLGHKLFFDARFSRTGEVSCSSCHLPDRGFQDGRPRGIGIGVTNRRTMPIAGTAYSPWFFWDGRKDSQWAQALGPLENPAEHGGNRSMYARLVARLYRADYEEIFGPLPDVTDGRRFPASAGPVQDPAARAAWEAMAPEDRAAVTRVFVNIGKSIAAYERKINPGASRFDAWAGTLLEGKPPTAATRLSPDEEAGLALFIGKADCIKCHNGALFTNNDFHNTGVPAVPGLPEDLGRAQGARDVLHDEFNCASTWSDARPGECSELEFLKADGPELVRAYKPPSLRNVAERPPYMHAGQLTTLAAVLRHYNAAPAAPSGHTELEPLGLGDRELGQLEAFLRTLSGPLQAPEGFLRAPVLP
jgi:cytochrome c peroxidase